MKNNPPSCGTKPMRKAYEIYGNSSLIHYNGSSNFGKLIHSGGHGCACRDSGIKLELSLVANTCSLSWDVNRFCSLIGAGILFIGDSMMEQTASVTMNHVLLSGSPECAEKVMFGNSDLLIKPTGYVGERGAPWVAYARRLRPKYVVLNAGPHIKTLELFHEIIDTVLQDANKSEPDMIVIWKTQYKGGCERKPDEHNWRLFSEFDKIVWEKWNASNILNVQMFDEVQNAHICGRGGYQDGMHYCIPGPLDSVPSILLSLLQNLQSVV